MLYDTTFLLVSGILYDAVLVWPLIFTAVSNVVYEVTKLQCSRQRAGAGHRLHIFQKNSVFKAQDFKINIK